MSSKQIVQWNYIIYFHIRASFFNNFLHQFLEKSAQFERNCKSTRFAWFDRSLRRFDHTQKQTPQCSVKKVFIKISEACHFIKKEALVQVFSSEFCEIFKNTFLYRALRWLLLHISTNKVLIYYLKSIFDLKVVYIIYHSCCFYIQYHKSVQTFCFILCSILLTRQRNIRLFYITFVLTIGKRSRLEVYL